MTMKDRNLNRGESYMWKGTWLHRDGSPVNFNLGVRYGLLRIVSQEDGSVLTLDTRQVDTEWAWEDKDNGIGYWLLGTTKSAALVVGRALADALLYDADVLPDPEVITGGCATYIIADGCAAPLIP